MSGRFSVTGWGAWRSDGLEPSWASPGGRREEPAVEAAARAALRCLERAELCPGAGLALVLAVGAALEEINREHARCAAGRGPVSARRFLFTTANAVSARVAILAGVGGECLTVPDPVAPFWVAGDLLTGGAAEAVLVGGTSAAERRGGVGGAAALVCLELPERAAARGASPAGELRLEPPGSGEVLAVDGEESGAAWVIAGLAADRTAVLDGGRRGRMILEPLEQRERRHR